MNLLKTSFISLILVQFFISSCKKDEFLTSTEAKLEFSTDSVLFDTVFTTVGSTTRNFKIYNRHNKPLKISKIFLVQGATSQFRMNIDGFYGTSITDIEISPKDSLFAFVQVTVNPLNSNSPMLINETIIFETNGNFQNVELTAIGQDVYLHRPDKPSNKPFYSIIGCNETWTNDKPHLIFGYAVVDSACTLTMMPGTRVHLNLGAVLWIYKGGKLDIKGSYGNEVKIEGARLEPEYKEVPGQWGKIWLSQGSLHNRIDWAIIKNGGIGVQADTIATIGTPTLTMSNTIIKNMTAAAIFGQGSHIRAYNSVFANCGQYVAALTIGGKYKFDHCTFANYWRESQRATPLLAMSNYYIAAGNLYVIRNLDSAYFGNCILYGDIDEEIGLDSTTFPSAKFNYKFENCILKTELNTTSSVHYSNTFKNNNPGFKNTAENNYQLTPSSFAIDRGFSSNYFIDLNNKFRPNPNTSLSDIGAYEFYQ